MYYKRTEVLAGVELRKSWNANRCFGDLLSLRLQILWRLKQNRSPGRGILTPLAPPFARHEYKPSKSPVFWDYCHDIPEERRSHLHRGECLNSRLIHLFAMKASNFV